MSPRSATPAQNVALSNPTAGSHGIDPSTRAVRTLLFGNLEKKWCPSSKWAHSGFEACRIFRRESDYSPLRPRLILSAIVFILSAEILFTLVWIGNSPCPSLGNLGIR